MDYNTQSQHGGVQGFLTVDKLNSLWQHTLGNLLTCHGSYANESSSPAAWGVTVQDESATSSSQPPPRPRRSPHPLARNVISSVVAGTAFVDGTAVITSARVTENAEDFPDFEITAKEYKSL